MILSSSRKIVDLSEQFIAEMNAEAYVVEALKKEFDMLFDAAVIEKVQKTDF